MSQSYVNLLYHIIFSTKDRENADEVSLQRAQQVVNGVLADPLEGPDSALYESFGDSKARPRKWTNAQEQ